MKVENFGIEAYDFSGVMPQKIIRLGHPTLHQKAVAFEDPCSEEAREIAKQLLATIHDFGPVSGLAAPQIDHLKRVFVFQVPPHRSSNPVDVTVAINPVIEPIGDEKESMWEGCLSVPDFFGTVERFKKIRYSYYDFFGNFVEGIAEDFHARVMQHEYDHLEGVMYLDRVKDSRDFGYMDEIKAFRF